MISIYLSQAQVALAKLVLAGLILAAGLAIAAGVTLHVANALGEFDGAKRWLRELRGR